MQTYLRKPSTDLEKTMREIVERNPDMPYKKLCDVAYRECAMAGRFETRQEIRTALVDMMQRK